MIKINNVAMPTPSGYTVGIMDIVNAERNAKGDMIIDLINTKYKIEVEWPTMDQATMSRLLSALESKVTFQVEFIDPITGNMKTSTFYKGDRNIPMMDFLNGKARWKNFKINLIEV